MSGLVGGWALSWVTTAGHAARSCSRSELPSAGRCDGRAGSRDGRAGGRHGRRLGGRCRSRAVVGDAGRSGCRAARVGLGAGRRCRRVAARCRRRTRGRSRRWAGRRADGCAVATAGVRADGTIGWSPCEHGELELEAQAADPGAVRVDGGEAPAGRGQGGRVVAPRTVVVETRDQLGADRLDGLVEQRPDVATALLEAVEERDAGRPVARRRDGRRTPSRPRRRPGRGGRGRSIPRSDRAPRTGAGRASTRRRASRRRPAGR